MKQRFYLPLLLAGMITLVDCMLSSCIKEVPDEITSNRITFSIDDQDYKESKVTRGAKVSSITSFGVSASVYDAASTYASAGCGSFFFDESATAGTPMDYYWPTSDYKLSFFGYYPKGNAAFTLQSTANTTGVPTYAYTVPSAIGSQLDIMTGQNLNHLGGGTTPVSLTMKHRCASICFSVTNSRSSAITLNSISIEGVKYSGTLNEDNWTLTSAVNSSSSNPFTLSYGSSIAASATVDVTGTTNIFLMLPQTIPAGAKVKVVIDGEDPLYADLTGSWVASRQYSYTLDVQNNTVIIVDEDTEIEDWEPYAIDLSMVDNAGNARVSMTTANCYLVHAAGDYKLPLVYGNAIKNGTDNRIAYYPGEESSISNGTDQFVNHAGTPLSGPWLTKSGSGVNAGMGLAVATAELLWQDKSGLITNVSVSGNYLKFTVGSFGGGNALIAVKDSNGTILWSWHIWATDDDLSNTTVVSTGSHDYTVASVNLGWVPTGGDGKQGYCPYYQWGRKDPFIPAAAYNSTTNHTVYNISGASITGLTYQESTTATIADNIKNPTYHYYNSSNRGPVTTTYYNMWDAQNTATNNVTTATVKTIYDPCPPGFCVPTGNLWYYFGGNANPTDSNSRNDSNWDSTDKGKTWTLNGASIYFPAASFRLFYSGSLIEVGTFGDYWSATPSSANHGYSLNFNSIAWACFLNDFRTYGFSVRPVAEE